MTLQNLFEQCGALLQVNSSDGRTTVLLKWDGMYFLQVQAGAQIVSHVPLGHDYDISVNLFTKEAKKYI
jgi:hypothetical protein